MAVKQYECKCGALFIKKRNYKADICPKCREKTLKPKRKGGINPKQLGASKFFSGVNHATEWGELYNSKVIPSTHCGTRRDESGYEPTSIPSGWL